MKTLYYHARGATAAGVTIGLLILAPSSNAQVVQGCGPMVTDTQYGPYNYVTEHDKVKIVNSGHFPPQVENLIQPKWGEFGNDLSYTLQRIPNHHRALITLVRLGQKEKSPQPRGLRSPIDCYFEFATRFAPNDLVVRLIFARHLISTNRAGLARQALDHVVNNAGENPLTHFNAGLIYFEMEEYQQALMQAHTAAKLGLIRPELQSMLEKVGQWQDP
jgi:hypothetical protein